MTELENGVTFDIPVGRREAETPAEIFNEDIRLKKSCVPKYVTKNTISIPTKKQFIDNCGDMCKISLGYPMIYAEYLQITSDDLRRVYLESMTEKYPGISVNLLSKMFGIGYNTARKEVNRLGVNLGKPARRNIAQEYIAEIMAIQEKISNGEMSKNLTITKNRKVKKFHKKTYKDLKEMSLINAKIYITDLNDRYGNALTTEDFCNFLNCADSTLYKFFKKIGIHLRRGAIGASSSVVKIRQRFYDEMLPELNKTLDYGKDNKECVNNQEPITDAQPIVSSDPEPSNEDDTPKFDINVIECTLDSENIAKFLETYGFSGRIKIRVEKI